jgi:hypothetical protein
MDPEILEKRRKFTVRCTAECGAVIEDGNGKKGGNLRTHWGVELSWKNLTGEETCYLQFTTMRADDSDEPSQPCWPFTAAEPADKLLQVPKGPPVVRTLQRVNETMHVEYVVLGAAKQPLLDPVIIIDPN